MEFSFASVHHHIWLVSYPLKDGSASFFFCGLSAVLRPSVHMLPGIGWCSADLLHSIEAANRTLLPVLRLQTGHCCLY